MNPEQEADAIGTCILQYMQSGVNPSEIAIFYRLNDMSRAVEQALIRRRIPYRIVGGQSFYDRMEIRDCLAMLRIMSNPKDAEAFLRIASRLVSGLGEKTIGAIENFSEAHGHDLLHACTVSEQYMPMKTAAQIGKIKSIHHVSTMFSFDRAAMKPADCLTEVVKRLNYKGWLEAHEADPRKLEDRQRNVDEMVTSIAQFCEERAGASLADYLQYVTLLTNGDDDKEEKAVNLMSGHSCKGLEFDIVFCLGLEHNLLPHQRAVSERPDYGLDEERRLFYVMMTRARKILHVDWCKERAVYKGGKLKVEPRSPSQFLPESKLMSIEDFEKLSKYVTSRSDH